MSKKKAIKIIIPALIVIVVIGLIFCAGFFFHRLVKIETEYEISEITIEEPEYGIRKTVNKKTFYHYAPYGRFYYQFDLTVNGKTIPAEISVFKANNHEHDNVCIDIYKGGSDSEIIVDVFQSLNHKGKKPLVSEKFMTDDTHKIIVSAGP